MYNTLQRGEIRHTWYGEGIKDKKNKNSLDTPYLFELLFLAVRDGEAWWRRNAVLVQHLMHRCVAV